MKNGGQKLKSDERDLLMKATNALIESFGLQVSVHLSSTSTPSTIEISLPNQKKKYIYESYIQKKADYTTLGLAKLHFDKSKKDSIFISEYIPSVLAKDFKELNIQFIDSVGNAYIQKDSLLIFLAGNRLEKKSQEKFINRAGLEVMFALLSVPNLESENYRKISELTGISLGAVALTMKGLENQGFLVARKKKRVLIRKTELVNLWVQNYPQILRPKYQFDHKFSQQNPNWWKAINLESYKSYWSGEVAGYKLTNYLEPQKFTIYQDTNTFTPNLIAENGWRINKTGDIELLLKFWNFPTESDIAPPLLVYADLVATADPRNLEVAKMVYDEHILKLIGENS